MLSAALFPFLVSLTLPTVAPAAPAVTTTAADPAVRVWLDHRTYERGDRARVHVRARDDGYLIVLHLDPDGRVRVLFPLDPIDDNFIRGQKDYEIRARGDREAFEVDEPSGSGTVYAAISRDPIHFDEYTRNDHWDYRVLDDSALARDAEVGFTNLVSRMTDGAHFDYDVVTYDIARPVAYATAYAPPAPYWCDPWYDAWCGAGYYPYPFYRSGFTFIVGVGPFWFGRPFYRHRPFYYGWGYAPCDPFWGCRYGPWWRDRSIVIINRPTVIGWWPHQYPIYPRVPVLYGSKPGAPLGGAGPGIRYRPRDLTPGERTPMSPLYPGTRFARDAGRRDPLSWMGNGRARQPEHATFGDRRLPNRGGDVKTVGLEGRDADIRRREPTVFASPVGDRPDRRNGARDGLIDVRPTDRTPIRVEPRDGATRPGLRDEPLRGGDDATSRGGGRLYEPRSRTEDAPRYEPRSEPRADQPRYQPRPDPRSEPRIESPRLEPRSMPREEAPRRVESPRAMERSMGRPDTRGGGGRRP